ncbi:MAG: CBS domain-containing protein [Caldisericaceae bacterium]|nr:CBS domain-containing protein [Caldisericaceae bacterium]
MKVKDVHKYITIEPPVVKEDTPIKEVIKALLKDPRSRSVYVVNEKEVLTGIIPTSTVIKATHILKGKKTLRKEDAFDALKISMAKVAKDIMHPPVYVFEDEDIKDVLEEMVVGEYQELPVVNRQKKVIGDLNCLEIIRALWEI